MLGTQRQVKLGAVGSLQIRQVEPCAEGQRDTSATRPIDPAVETLGEEEYPPEWYEELDEDDDPYGDESDEGDEGDAYAPIEGYQIAPPALTEAAPKEEAEAPSVEPEAEAAEPKVEEAEPEVSEAAASEVKDVAPESGAGEPPVNPGA